MKRVVEITEVVGMTPTEFARLTRMGRRRIVSEINAGNLEAINTSRGSSPRYIIMPDAARKFLQSLTVAATANCRSGGK